MRRAIDLLAAPSCSVAGFKHLLLCDPVVALRLLQLANSHHFDAWGRVGTISEAVVLLGRRRIGAMLNRMLAEEVRRRLGRESPAAAGIRRVSLATAASAAVLSRALHLEDSEEMRLAGLLHNLAEWVPNAPPLLAEGRLPDLPAAVAAHWHAPLASECPLDRLVAASLIHSGRHIADAYLVGAGPEAAFDRIAPELRHILQLDSGFVAAAYHALPAELTPLDWPGGPR